MNCKRGDMALVFRRPVVTGTHNGRPMNVELFMAGEVVTVKQLSDQHDGSWIFEEPIPGVRWETSTGLVGHCTCCGCPDEFLRPLPPLSDDELDQAEAGKPEQVAA